jgi:putative two-component system response regulator
MPEMGGFEVLEYMKKEDWIEDIPVIMISAENDIYFIKRAYNLGASDYINRPFDADLVKKRVRNTIMLYAKQRTLQRLVAKEILANVKTNSLMVSVLAHIVEFRNMESSDHISHVKSLTYMLLKALERRDPSYRLTPENEYIISTASALHDIGKIAIDDEILNKPGKLTSDEYDAMKEHAMQGYTILENVPDIKNEELIRIAKEICRWHHERYDGGGYPDGLRGEEIPISAQIVSIADVYDALTSERCYKKAFDHETAMKMILDGECGTFNPKLLRCLQDIEYILQDRDRLRKTAEAGLTEIAERLIDSAGRDLYSRR